MKKIVFLLFLFFLITGLQGQEKDSIHAMIQNHHTSDEMIIKGRSLMAEYLQNNDFAQCSKIEKYLSESFKGAFIWEERATFAFLRRDFAFLVEISNFKEMDLLTERIYYAVFGDDSYKELLMRKIDEEEADIQTQINALPLSQKEKDFLTVFLQCLLSQSNHKMPYRLLTKVYSSQDIQQKVDKFLSAYPSEQDSLSNFIKEKFSQTYRKEVYKRDEKELRRKIYRFQCEPHKWGWGIDLISLGISVYDGDLDNKYRNSPFAKFGFNVSYDHFVFQFHWAVASSKLKQDITINKVLQTKDSTMNISCLDLTLGYIVLNHSYIRILPYIGASWANIYSLKSDIKLNPRLKKAKIPFMFNPVVGLDIHFKLSRRIYDMEAYLPLILSYSYHFLQFGKKYPGFGGGVHQIAIGIGITGNGCKQKKRSTDKLSQ